MLLKWRDKLRLTDLTVGVFLLELEVLMNYPPAALLPKKLTKLRWRRAILLIN
jgi:hypothetical protein